MNNFVQPSHYDQSHSERRKSVTQQLLKTEKISHWSDDAININEDPGVVSEIEDDELLDDLVTPVDTPSHSSEDILEMFDNTGLNFSISLLLVVVRVVHESFYICGM